MADQYLLDALKELLEKSRQYKLSEREPNFFDTAMRKHYENPTTELLSFFINSEEAHQLGTIFFDSFIQCIHQIKALSHEEIGNFIAVETEITTSDGKRIDLIIETTTHLIVVECKVHHSQFNPVHSYESYAEKRTYQSSKKVIYLVLCISGISEFDNPSWYGISYKQLVKAFHNITNSAELLANSKWFVLAREFILHLENYYESPMHLESFNFIKTHSDEVHKLIQLSEQVYSQINEHIIQNMQNNLQEKFQIRNCKVEFYNNNPEFWFSNKKLDRWICPTLEIEKHKKDLPCRIHFCIERPSERDHEFIQHFINKFSEFQKPNKLWLYKNSVEYMRFTFAYNSLDLDQVTSKIIEINEFVFDNLIKEKNEKSNIAVI